MKTNTIPVKLYTTRETAKLLGVSLRTIQLWVESGVLPAWKTAGGHRRIPQNAIDTFLDKKHDALNPQTIDENLGDEGHELSILIVEDEADLRELYKMNISGWKMPLKIFTASNGFEGLIQVGQHIPNILISDLVMPGMDGFRMIRTLRANHEFDHMIINVVTALDKEEIDDRGGLPDKVNIFTKPVRYSELERITREYYQKHMQANAS